MFSSVTPFTSIMQSSLQFQDSEILNDIDSCYGFLFDDYVDEYESTHYLLPCDSRDYVDIRHTTEDDTIPLPGEFPLADFQHVDCSISCCVKPVLTEPSFRALCTLSDEDYSHWWGIGTTYTDRSSSKDPDEVSIRSGLSHFRDIIMAVEHNQEECGTECPLVCPMSLLFRFYMPVVTLRVTGFPPETTANTLLRLFRIFGSVYRVHVESGGASCTMSSETAYTILKELHNHVVNGVRLLFSF
ncbi:hypothetical protein WA538_001803 [Blastocystis sp. DL]